MAPELQLENFDSLLRTYQHVIDSLCFKCKERDDLLARFVDSSTKVATIEADYSVCDHLDRYARMGRLRGRRVTDWRETCKMPVIDCKWPRPMYSA